MKCAVVALGIHALVIGSNGVEADTGKRCVSIDPRASDAWCQQVNCASDYKDLCAWVPDVPTAAPTPNPTQSTTAPTAAKPTQQPTSLVTKAPTSSVTNAPTSSVTNAPTAGPSGDFVAKVKSFLMNLQSSIDNNVLLYETPTSTWIPSKVYKTKDMVDAVGVMATIGAGDNKLFVGETGQAKAGEIYGLVNIAAFLAQALHESIHYDACDENNWDMINGASVYPLSNSCGQLGQSYQDYTCSAAEAHMACEVDPTMTINATTHAQWWGAPAPFFCGPKSRYPATDGWDPSATCPDGKCDVYIGQQGGAFTDTVTANKNGRTDVESCCWWGRGVIQTTGLCNYGKLNYYLGARAKAEGRTAAYPDVNFCKTPDAICSSTEHTELKWIAGFFYWLDSVQYWNTQEFDYMDSLVKFTDKLAPGFDPSTDTAFIDAVSGIVNRGCPSLTCPTGPVDSADKRRANFYLVLETFGLI